MFKIFSLGIFLGLVLAGGAAYFMPVADLKRETSLVTVRPNGGVVEALTIGIPEDRIMVGTADPSTKLPGNLKWPQELTDAGIGLELFKLRNRDGVVIGVASRLESVSETLTDEDASEDFDSVTIDNHVEWVLDIPARGSLYFLMSAEPDAGGQRSGPLRGGTREFGSHSGTLTERFVPTDELGGGRIELQSIVVANALPEAEGVSP